MTIQTYTATAAVGNAYQSNGNTAVTFMSFCNYSGSQTATIDVYIVPALSSYSTQNQIYASLQLTPKDTYQLYLGGEKLILGQGDTIQVGSAGTDISVVTSYTTI
jgi:hypothetical protein